AIAEVIEAGIRTTEAVHAAELAKPVAGLRERDSNVPATSLRSTARECRHGRERHEVAGGVVEHLCRERSRLARTASLRFRGIEAPRRLDQRVEPAAARPRAFVPVSAERNVDDAGPDPCDVLRAKTERGNGARPVTLHKNVCIPQQRGEALAPARLPQIEMCR